MPTKSLLGWRAYCRKLALGTGLAATEARMCLAIGSVSPGQCRTKLTRQLRLQQITPDEYTTRIDSVDDTDERWRNSVETHVDPCLPSGGWISLGGGSHLRQARNYET